MGHGLEKTTRRAIGAIRGVKSIINPGDKVFVKPNAVGWGTGTPENDVIVKGARTKPEIVVTVVDERLKASQVIIGERGQNDASPHLNSFYLDGRTQVKDVIAQFNER